MNEQQLQQAFIQFLAQKTGAKTQQELEAAIQQMGEQGLQAAYQEFMQMMQQQQVQAAKFGAKLNYIKSLRGQCPEGYEISYYKVGGTLCKKCMKKQQEMKDGGQVPKNPIDEFKCGRKMKKKKAQGGAVDFEKCGGKTKKKTKKKEEGGELNSTRNPNTFSKMALAKCGAKLKEACKGMQVGKCGKKLKKKIISKHQLGGALIKGPWTGFEGVSYQYEAPNPSTQGRADRPETETILVGGKPFMYKETYYDPDAYEQTGKLQQLDAPQYSVRRGNQWSDNPSDTQLKAFASLKRHALSNQQRNKKLGFYQTGKKIPYKSELGYTQNRGGGTQYVHRVYPENDSYYIDMQYNEDGLMPGKSKRFIYNPTGADFNYDDYDYSNTVPAKKFEAVYNNKTKDFDYIDKGVYQFYNHDGTPDTTTTMYQRLSELRNQNFPLVTPKVYEGTPVGYRGKLIYK